MPQELIYTRHELERARRLIASFDEAGPVGRTQPDQAQAVVEAAAKVARQLVHDLHRLDRKDLADTALDDPLLKHGRELRNGLLKEPTEPKLNPIRLDVSTDLIAGGATIRLRGIVADTGTSQAGIGHIDSTGGINTKWIILGGHFDGRGFSEVIHELLNHLELTLIPNAEATL